MARLRAPRASSASPANAPSSRRPSQPTASDGAANGHGRRRSAPSPSWARRRDRRARAGRGRPSRPARCGSRPCRPAAGTSSSVVARPWQSISESRSSASSRRRLRSTSPRVEPGGQLGLERALGGEVGADRRGDLRRLCVRVDALVQRRAVQRHEQRRVAALRQQPRCGAAPDRHMGGARLLDEAERAPVRPGRRGQVGVRPADVVLLGGEAEGLARRRRRKRLVAPGPRELSRHPGVRRLTDDQIVVADQHGARG